MASSSKHTSDEYETHDTENTSHNISHFVQDNPLHLQSSDSPGMKLVNECFDGSGFSNWKRSMIIALSARNKLGFVDGSIPKPDPQSSSFKSWSRCNDMVISWILGALSKSIGRSVIYCNSAHQMWKELGERYGVSNGAQLFGLHKELSEISQGNSNVADYFTKLKMLWDDIDSLCMVPVCSCGCHCGAAQQTSIFYQNQRIIQFLMGLNDTYHVIRGSILMSNPLPSIGQVYNLLLQEEAQREIHSSNNFLADAAANSVSRSYPNQYRNKNSGDIRKSTLTCNYCKKPGHIMAKCYRLHGFPNDFKFTNSKKVAANVETNVPAHQSSTTGLTSEMYSQIISLLKSAQPVDSDPSHANFAGLFSEEATGSW